VVADEDSASDESSTIRPRESSAWPAASREAWAIESTRETTERAEEAMPSKAPRDEATVREEVSVREAPSPAGSATRWVSR